MFIRFYLLKLGKWGGNAVPSSEQIGDKMGTSHPEAHIYVIQIKIAKDDISFF